MQQIYSGFRTEQAQGTQLTNGNTNQGLKINYLKNWDSKRGGGG